MIPVAELRVGLPAGVAMGLPIPLALLAGVMGNMLPVPFVILFIRRIFKWIRVHIPKLGALVDRLEARAYAKMQSKQLVRYEVWGLLAFVAIPLPGTGAWTGSLIAALMDLRLKNAVPVIFCGVVIAGLIMTALTYGVTALL
ncbi:MAG: small multidrug export protein [Ruminococcaceae bacterium]|nr:small multidrug export protein [Oscillospiraceae bacterium]